MQLNQYIQQKTFPPYFQKYSSLLHTIKTNPLVMSKLSKDVSSKDWIKIADEIEKGLNEGVHGIVVTNGTFTMGYTSAALSFMLRNIPVPIIFTGLQVPQSPYTY